MYVDGHLPGDFGERHKVSGLPTMQFTATGIVVDISRCLTMEFKVPGDLVYVVGETLNELGGSEYYEMLGYTGLNVPRVDWGKNLLLYRAMEDAVKAGLPASCHAVTRGGLAAHIILAALGGDLGVRVDLGKVPVEQPLRNDRVLFSESCGRFLVTVPPGNRREFESRFHGLTHGLVGEVLADPEMVILSVDGKTLLREPVGALRRSWKDAG